MITKILHFAADNDEKAKQWFKEKITPFIKSESIFESANPREHAMVRIIMQKFPDLPEAQEYKKLLEVEVFLVIVFTITADPESGPEFDGIEARPIYLALSREEAENWAKQNNIRHYSIEREQVRPKELLPESEFVRNIEHEFAHYKNPNL